MTGFDWGMLVLLSMLWGGSFFFVGVAIKEVPVFTIVAYRVCLAAIILHLVLRIQGISFPMERQPLLAFLGMSLLNNVIPFNLIVFGQSQIESGLASILNATTPIFTMVLAHLLTRDEKLGWRKGMGVLLGFAGVVILFADGSIASKGALLGQLACIGASLSYGFSGVFGRRFAGLGLQPMVIATGQLTISALVMLPLATIIDQPFGRPLPGFNAFLAMSMLALFSTALAYILFFRILTRAGATNVSLVTLLVPCSAILLGAAFLGETPGMRALAGFATIAIGLLVIDGRVFHWIRRISA